MDDLWETYEELVLEEDELIKKLRVCESCFSLVFDHILRCGDFDVQIGERILTAIHFIEKELHAELLHIKLEKGFLANKIKLMKAKGVNHTIGE